MDIDIYKKVEVLVYGSLVVCRNFDFLVSIMSIVLGPGGAQTLHSFEEWFKQGGTWM